MKKTIHKLELNVYLAPKSKALKVVDVDKAYWSALALDPNACKLVIDGIIEIQNTSFFL